VHGSSNVITSFRNYMVGWETGKTANTNPVHVYTHSRYYNFIGNVLGKSGYHNQYEANNSSAIWNFGEGYSNAPDDPMVATTTLRWGNYDTVTGTTKFVASESPSNLSFLPNPVPSSQALPTSMYLSAKPSWWGSVAWPPIGPDVSGGNITGVAGHVYKIPAQLCYESMVSDPAYAGDPAGVKIFTPSTCYTTSSSSTPLVGDINSDHIVNSIDYSILNSHWFTNDANSDLNHDGLVNAIDFSMLNANWFKTW
jgi:hypothetical protein